MRQSVVMISILEVISSDLTILDMTHFTFI